MTTLSHVERGEKSVAWMRDAVAVIGASILIALCGRIAIPLPFTPVPIALQPHICLFLGILLGSRKAPLAVIAFILQGISGLPVFATGAGGLGVLAGPTGGYLLGYIVGAFLTGYLWERTTIKTAGKIFLVLAAGNIAIYALGVAHLSHFLGLKRAIFLGVAPFLIGDVLKLFVSVRVLKSLKAAV